MFQSNSKYYIKSRISATQGTGTTFLISTDVELNQNLNTGADTTSIVIKSGSQIERMEITALAGIATIVRRGLTQSSSPSQDTSFNKEWNDGAIMYVTALASDLIDKSGDVMTGPLSFTGLHSGVKPPKMTNTEMNALLMAPSDVGFVYNTTMGQYYTFSNGSWSAIANGVSPNASETVAGKVEIATLAEVTSGTQTGTTGAILSISPDKYIADRNLFYTQMVATGAETTGGIVDNKTITPLKLQQKIGETISSDAEALAGVINTKCITPKQAKDNYSTTTYTKAVEISFDGSVARTEGEVLYTLTHSLGRIPKSVKVSGATQAFNSALTSSVTDHVSGFVSQSGQSCAFLTGVYNDSCIYINSAKIYIDSITSTDIKLRFHAKGILTTGTWYLRLSFEFQ